MFRFFKVVYSQEKTICFVFFGSCFCVTSPHPFPSSLVTAVPQGPQEESITRGHYSGRDSVQFSQTDQRSAAKECVKDKETACNKPPFRKPALLSVLNVCFAVCLLQPGVGTPQSALPILRAGTPSSLGSILSGARHPSVLQYGYGPFGDM